MKTFQKLIEDIANVASSGAISGMGYNLNADPETQPQVAGRAADDLAIHNKKKKDQEKLKIINRWNTNLLSINKE